MTLTKICWGRKKVRMNTRNLKKFGKKKENRWKTLRRRCLTRFWKNIPKNTTEAKKPAGKGWKNFWQEADRKADKAKLHRIRPKLVLLKTGVLCGELARAKSCRPA